MGLFAKNTQVINVTNSDFTGGKLKKSTACGMIFFGAGWCHYCVKASPEFEKAAKMLGSSYNFYFLDCSDDGSFANKNFKVNGYPTIKFVSKNGVVGEDYTGERKMNSFIDAVLKCKK
jgi:thiol-disulfide isomerase/thioredoxin